MSFVKLLRNLLLKNTKDMGTQEEIKRRGGVKVGNNCSIYSWGGIDSNWPFLISIGDNVIISSDVTILAHDASPNIIGCGTKLGRVTIGNNVFIGAKSIILCNVSIGDNVVIGAGSVVTRSLPSGFVYAGNPAKSLYSIEEYRTKHMKQKDSRPNFGSIRSWNEWLHATNVEKQEMVSLLQDGPGYV